MPQKSVIIVQTRTHLLAHMIVRPYTYSRTCVRVCDISCLFTHTYAIVLPYVYKNMVWHRKCAEKVEFHSSIFLNRWPSNRVMNIACVRIAAGKCYFPIYLILWAPIECQVRSPRMQIFALKIFSYAANSCKLNFDGMWQPETPM